MSRIVYATASVRGGILQRSVQCRRGVIGQFNQAASPFCSSSQPKINNASVSDIPKLGGEDRKDTSNHSDWDYDILVNGGGIVGITFVAKVLQKTSNILRIGIIDVRPPPSLSTIREKEQPDIRVYALSPTSINILKEIDAWKHIEARTQPYHNMQIWESSGPGVVRFAAKDLNEPELGRIVEDCTIQAAVYESIKEKGHVVDYLFGSSITGLRVDRLDSNSHGPAVVTLSSSSSSPTASNPVSVPVNGSGSKPISLTARLVIGADGANSQVRKLGGFGSWGWGYGQEAVVCTVKVTSRDTVRSSEGSAWQRYLETGEPLALLPLWGDYSSIVWSTSVTQSRRLCGLSDEEFLSELNTALQRPSEVDRWSPLYTGNNGSDTSNSTLQDDFPSFSPLVRSVLQPLQEAVKRVQRPLRRVKMEVAALADTAMTAALLQNPFQQPPRVVEIVSKRITFPLQFQQAKTYSSARIALIGDAAHSIHPQAGQGLNLGLQDADTLSDLVLLGLGSGQDIGSPQLLKEYEARRYYSNLSMMSIVDTINTAFSIGKRDHMQPSSPQSQSSSSSEGVEKLMLFLRSAGMLGINSMGSLKGRIAKIAMGLQNKKTGAKG